MSGDPDPSPESKPEENKFGFGVPEEREELDPTIFDDEFDTKAAFSFNKAQKFENGVEKMRMAVLGRYEEKVMILVIYLLCVFKLVVGKTLKG